MASALIDFSRSKGKSRSFTTTTSTSASTCPVFQTTLPDAARYRIDAVRQKVVFFSGEETLSDSHNVDDVREYSGTAGLGCDCCEITGVDAKMKDGVLRMIVSRVKVKDHDKKCTNTVPPNTGKSGRYDLNEMII
ncbi:unnamed protein product [Eruca vesicaria subsp. sativa]|uniref:Uncharacterized protein n=1 Tax=Eruca vesicaria subsp. sativa TaxID=29727 RepID=A0ABC8J486_ERUVS|nr:unnamed protein product [Eruca vesicaria subsp. sativa]